MAGNYLERGYTRMYQRRLRDLDDDEDEPASDPEPSHDDEPGPGEPRVRGEARPPASGEPSRPVFEPADPFVDKGPAHNGAVSSVEHWQLRNLLVALPPPGGDGEGGPRLYMPHERTVREYWPQQTKWRDALALQYKPTCVTAAGEVLAAGGSAGQVDVVRLRADGREEASDRGSATVGPTVANALHLPPCGDPRLYVSTNEAVVQVYDVATMREESRLEYPVAVNHACPSPDGSLICAVGDGTDAYLTPGAGQGVSRHTVMPAVATDVGMCCAWSPGGTCVATAWQDGTVCVVEARAPSRPLLRARLPAAARAIAFSGPGAALLAVTEDAGYCHVMDTRDWGAYQTLQCWDTGPEGRRPPSADLSGLAFSPAGDALYVGCSHEGAAEFRVRVDERRTFARGGTL